MIVPNVNLNIESLQGTQQIFVNQSAALQELIGAVNNALQQTQWESPAATAFRGTWADSYYPNLQKVYDGMMQFQGLIAQQLQRYMENEGLAP